MLSNVLNKYCTKLINHLIRKQSINVKLIIIKTTYKLLLTYYTKTYLYFCGSIQKKKLQNAYIYI